MGNVEYSRRVYELKLEDGKKATKYLLDEYLGMDYYRKCFYKSRRNYFD